MEYVCQVCAASFTEAGFCSHDGSPLRPSTEDPLIGSIIGPYRVESLIGVGGMGRVYRAVHPTIGSRVAVKVLADHCAGNPQLVARFFDEARAVNLIRHENIVNILDLAFLSDGRPYIVMEYLDGQPLSSAIESAGALPIGTVLRVIEDVLSALDAAHQQQIIHRDLKPDNIFISPKGRAYVLDFGVAKLSSDQTSMKGQTQEGSLLGTPYYMSPEQALSRGIDARADIYSIGVILYECLTGQKPFRAESLFVLLEQHVHQMPENPGLLRPQLSPSLQGIILRAMEKDPDARWQSVRELSGALQQEQQGLAELEWAPIGLAAVASSASNSPSHPPSVPNEVHAGPGRSPAPSAAPAPHGPASYATPAPKSRGMLWGLLILIVGAAAGAALFVAQGGAASTEVSAEPTLIASTEDGAPPIAVEAVLADAGVERVVAVARVFDAAMGAPRHRPLKGRGKTDAGIKRVAKKDDKPIASKGRPDAGIRAPVAERATEPSALPKRDSSKTSSPARFDVSGYLSKAQARARQAFDDAVLVRIDASGVLPNGKANLTLSSDFSVLYRFISPSRGKRPKSLPLGVVHKPTCLFYVLVDPQSTSNYPLEGWDCSKLSPIGRPRCSPAQIWKRAIADGAPKENAVAELGFRKFGGAKKWYFSIKDTISKVYADDC